MKVKDLHAKIEDMKETLSRHDNKLNNQECRIKIHGEEIDLLQKHRETHDNEFISIHAKQDNAAAAITRLTEAIEGLTTKITTLFTIKNMVLGGFITLSTVIALFAWVLNLILDHYK